MPNAGMETKMKKNQLRGWKDVYHFTITQNIKNKSFIVSTVVVTLLVAILCACINFLPAMFYEMQDTPKEKKEVKVDTVYINDQSGLHDLDYTQILNNGECPETMKIVEVTSKECLENVDEAKDLYVEITTTETTYDIKGEYTKGSSISKSSAKKVLKWTSEYFKNAHYAELDITEGQLLLNGMSFQSEVVMADDDGFDPIGFLVEYFVNLTVYILFFMLIQNYGKMTANVVAMEKSSKVMELLLTSVRPVATIFGKILAMTVLLIMQIGLWILTGIVSYTGSNAILAGVDSKYADGLSKFLDFVKSVGITLELSPVRILIAIAIVVTGFMIYNSIAGFFGATVSKIEELGQALGTFSLLTVIGAYLSLFGYIVYLSSEGGNATLLEVGRYLPVSSLYIVPAELVLGTNTISTGLIALGINIATLAVVTVVISRVYEAVILHSGNRLKIKDVFAMSKNR